MGCVSVTLAWNAEVLEINKISPGVPHPAKGILFSEVCLQEGSCHAGVHAWALLEQRETLIADFMTMWMAPRAARFLAAL